MPRRPTMRAPVGKSGPWTRCSSASSSSCVGRLGVGEGPLHPRGDLAQVVGRDVGRHADGDACRAVDEQVREAARQDGRLGGATVVVGVRSRRCPRRCRAPSPWPAAPSGLGVSHRRGWVVTGRAEVSLPVNEWVAQRPGLREPDQGVVDRRVAVRVVLAHDVAHHARALGETAVGSVAAVVHRVEDPAVHWLKSVADVGQRARDDDAHRVVEVRTLHLDLEVDRLDPSISGGSGFGQQNVGHRRM